MNYLTRKFRMQVGCASPQQKILLILALVWISVDSFVNYFRGNMMATVNIFLIGAGTGAVLSIISMLIISAANAEQYPLGGFLPALWMVADLGVTSQLVAAGILMMGGMTGYYLVLTFWRERPESLKKGVPQQNDGPNDSPVEITLNILL